MELLTKTAQVERYLRRAILKGEWKAGEKLPTERELQNRLGVSQRTVREALIRISEDGLIERRQGAGTFVAKRPKVGTVAILANLDSLASKVGYYYRNVVEFAKKHIKESGFRPVLSVGHGNTPEEFASSVHLFDKSIARDIVGVFSSLDMGPLEEEFEKRDIPSVSIVAAKPTRQHCVVLDYQAMIVKGVKFLREKGYSEFALFYNDSPMENVEKELRLENIIRDGLVGAGISLGKVQIVAVPWSRNLEQAYDVFKRFWEQPRRPRAVFFVDDGTCEVALQAILELGIKVPDELSIITHSNKGRVFYFPVSVTRIEFDTEEAVRLAWEMMEKLINREEIDEPVIYLPPSVQEGESVKKI